MKRLFCGFAALLVGMVAGVGAGAQQAAAPVVRTDPAVEAARELVGRGTFLRCLCTAGALQFDAAGKLAGTGGKPVDWTLAAVNVLTVERKAPGVVEIGGVRAAVRWNADRREWERHGLTDEKIRLTLADAAGDERGFRRALDALFAVGIDPGLQRAMPGYWQHFFNPGLAWPPDAVGAQTVYSVQPASQSSPEVTAAVPVHRGEPEYTAEARHDKVQGTVQLRLVVTAEGTAERVAIVRPLGYGLDAKAAETVAKFRFKPGMREGKPVAEAVTVNQEYVLVPAPR